MKKLLFIQLLFLFTRSALASDSVYVVQPGDNLSVIAEKNNVNIYDLAKYNDISVTEPLLYGKKIKIPQKEIIKFDELTQIPQKKQDSIKNENVIPAQKIDDNTLKINIIPKKRSQNSAISQPATINVPKEDAPISTLTSPAIMPIVIFRKPTSSKEIDSNQRKNKINNIADLTKLNEKENQSDEIVDLNSEENEDNAKKQNLAVKDFDVLKKDGYILPSKNPILIKFREKYHNQDINGIIIKSKEKDPFVAINDCVIMYVGNDIKFFNFVVIAMHSDGNTSVYTNISPIVKKNQKVHKGDIIGYADKDGDIYFSVRKNQEAIDPLKLAND